MRDYVPAALLLAFSVVWAGVLIAWPRDGQPVAAIYPPGAAERAFADAANAGAVTILGFGMSPAIVVAQGEAPDFIEKLYQSGALMVVRAPARGDCLR